MWGGTDEAASIAAIRASIDAGVTLIDTAPAYGMGRSEEIVGKAHRRAARRGGDRHQVRAGLAHATRAGTSSTRTASRCTATSAATSIAHEVDAEPAAARHRPYRPLHHPLAGPDDAGRRDDGRARGPEARRQDPGDRRQQRRRRRPRGLYRGRRARRDPGAVQHGPPRDRGGARCRSAATTASRSSAIRRWRWGC